MTYEKAIEIGTRIFRRHAFSDNTITKVSEEDFIAFVEKALTTLIKTQNYRELDIFEIGYLEAINDFYNKCGEKIFKNDTDLSMADITVISRQLKEEKGVKMVEITDEHYKEVRFDKYCKTCKHEKVKDVMDPCNECLGEPANLYSEKPVKWEEK